MNRLDRLYRKALNGVKSREERKHIEDVAKELEEYFSFRKTTPMTDEEKADLQRTILEFEEIYG